MVKGTMNALFLKALARQDMTRTARARWGRQIRWWPDLGYDVVRTTRSDGTIEVGGRRVNAAEACCEAHLRGLCGGHTAAQEIAAILRMAAGKKAADVPVSVAEQKW